EAERASGRHAPTVSRPSADCQPLDTPSPLDTPRIGCTSERVGSNRWIRREGAGGRKLVDAEHHVTDRAQLGVREGPHAALEGPAVVQPSFCDTGDGAALTPGSPI